MRTITYPIAFLIFTFFLNLSAKTDTVYYENGKIRTIQSLNSEGLLEGKVFNFHKNGRKAFEANYTKGKIHGYATAWWENGKVARKMPRMPTMRVFCRLTAPEEGASY